MILDRRFGQSVRQAHAAPPPSQAVPHSSSRVRMGADCKGPEALAIHSARASCCVAMFQFAVWALDEVGLVEVKMSKGWCWGWEGMRHQSVRCCPASRCSLQPAATHSDAVKTNCNRGHPTHLMAHMVVQNYKLLCSLDTYGHSLPLLLHVHLDLNR